MCDFRKTESRQEMRQMTNSRIEADPAATIWVSSTSRPPAEDIAAGNAPERSEAELITQVKGGNVEAFYELVRPYERAVFLAALSLVKNDADAEEVSQEAILKAFKNLSRFRQEAKFSTWLIQISINEAKMKLRKDRRHLYESMDDGPQNDEGDYIPKDFADWREIPSEALEQKELRKALTQALNSLPEKYRTILILRDVQHLSIAETAQVLGLSEANVKTRLCRARLQMRDALAPGFDGAWSRGRTYEKVRPF
jgi:RNA polymerase sigma-70 factor (ECF subfamily)